MHDHKAYRIASWFCFSVAVVVFGFAQGQTARAGETLFTEDFQDGETQGWSATGNGNVRLTDSAGNISLQLTRSVAALRSLSSEGYKNISVSVSFAAESLELNEYCVADISHDHGLSWIEVGRIWTGHDDAQHLYTQTKTLPVLDDRPHLTFRVRVTGNGRDDKCWADNIIIMGDAIVDDEDASEKASPPVDVSMHKDAT